MLGERDGRTEARRRRKEDAPEKGEEMRARKKGRRSWGSIRRNCHARVAMNTDVLFTESWVLLLNVGLSIHMLEIVRPTFNRSTESC